MGKTKGKQKKVDPSLSSDDETNSVTSAKKVLRSRTKREKVELSHSTDDENDGARDEISIMIRQVSKQMKSQKDQMKKLTDSYDFMSDAFDKLQSELTKIRNENKLMKKDIIQLQINEKNLIKRIQSLERNDMVVRQSNNENHMIITNMPKINDNINLKEVITKIGEQVGYHVPGEEVIEVFQNENKDRKTYPIIVKLRNQNLKKKCMDFRKNGNLVDVKTLLPNITGHDSNINFYHLIEKELSELLKKTKTIAKNKTYKYVWYRNSTILVRKTDGSVIIKINNVRDLDKIV